MPRKSGEIPRGRSKNNFTLFSRFWTPDDFHEGYVEGWENRQGTLIPTMSAKTERVKKKDGYEEYEEEYYEMLPQIEEKLLKEKRRPPAKADHVMKKREEFIEELEQQIEDIKARSKEYYDWESVQIHRCLHGWRHLTGKQYFYFNFCWIEEVDDEGNGIGAIQPDYRQTDNWLFRRIYEAEKRKDGDLWAKRRRLGATWLIAGDAVYDMIFKDARLFFMSYDLLDAEKFFNSRIMYIYQRLPRFLKKPIINDNLRRKRFGPSPRLCEFMEKDINKVPIAEITTGSPSDEGSMTGGTFSKVYVDEIGEIVNLRQLLAWLTPVLMSKNGLTRAGCLILLGTVGSMDKAGATVKWLVDKPKVNKHAVTLAKGTYAVFMDEYGNDLEAKTQQYIMEERIMLEEANAHEELIAFKQKYPLEWKDCWVYGTLHKLMPMNEINIAKDLMDKSDWLKKRKFGIFHKDQNGIVYFRRQEPNPSSRTGDVFQDMIGYNQWCIWEDRQESTLRHPYAGGCDPVDIQKDRGGNPRTKAKHGMVLSDITCSIYKRINDIGQTSDFWVAEYHGRPFPLETAFEQILLAAEYYGCEINVERSKGAAFIAYAEATGRTNLLATGAGVALQMARNPNNVGYDPGERWWDNALGWGRQWWLRNYNKPVSVKFMYESEFVKEVNTDQWVAHMAALQLAKEYDTREASGYEREKVIKSAIQETNWQYGRNGRFQNIGNADPNALSYEARRELQRLRSRQRR